MDLASIGIRNLGNLLACFLFAEKGLKAFLEGGGAVNRDADQTLEYSAPRSLWKPYDLEMMKRLLSCRDELYALAPLAARASWPQGMETGMARMRDDYFKAVGKFFEEMSLNQPGARKRLKERIRKL